jgi:tetratricopeptide (TPR) repeat protein
MVHRGKECPRLSVAMIVRDAVGFLAATLDAVAPIADEVVVYDLASSDDTITLAQQKATRVIAGDWRDSYAAARNETLQHCTGDWILWVEAGEEFTPENATLLRKFIDGDAEPNTAYHVLVRMPARTWEIAGEQMAQLRLHPRRAELRFTGRVRESLLPAIEQHGIGLDSLPLVIHRQRTEHEPQLVAQEAQRRITLATLAESEAGEAATWQNCLGEAWQQLGNHERSAKHYRRAMELAPRGSSDMLEACYGVLTSLEGSDAARETQLQFCMTALEIFPLDTQLLCAIGGYLQARGQWELASRAYQLAASHGQVDVQLWHLEGLTEIAIHCQALSWQALGRGAEAEGLLKQQLASNAASPRLRRQLLELYVQQGRHDDAEQLLNALPWNFPGREPLRQAVRGSCLLQAGERTAGLTLLEGAYKAGCRDTVCLRALAQLYGQQHDWPQAERLLQEWLQYEPYSREARQLRKQWEQARTPTATPAVAPAHRIDGTSPLPRPAAPLAGNTLRTDRTIP